MILMLLSSYLSRFYYFVFDRIVIYPMIKAVSNKFSINFLNLGYFPLNSEPKLPKLQLLQQNLHEKPHIELYERTLALLPNYLNLEGQSLLEIGCGCGGGIAWIQR